jgi:hypothetical protein
MGSTAWTTCSDGESKRAALCWGGGILKVLESRNVPQLGVNSMGFSGEFPQGAKGEDPRSGVHASFFWGVPSGCQRERSPEWSPWPLGEGATSWGAMAVWKRHTVGILVE